MHHLLCAAEAAAPTTHGPDDDYEPAALGGPAMHGPEDDDDDDWRKLADSNDLYGLCPGAATAFCCGATAGGAAESLCAAVSGTGRPPAPCCGPPQLLLYSSPGC